MLKIVEASLIFCVTAAVMAFGGTEPISFAVVEMVLLGAVLAVLIVSKDFDWASSLRGAAVPASLIGLVIFQLVPLPGALVRLLRPDSPSLGASLPESDNHSFSSLSIAPYNTRNTFDSVGLLRSGIFFRAHAGTGSRTQATSGDMAGDTRNVRSALRPRAVSDWLAKDFWVREEIQPRRSDRNVH